MAKAKFYRRWKRRFRKGLTKIQSLLAECLCTGSSETIHDLRVTLRRIRMLAVIGTPALGKSEAGNFRQWALKVTTTLGRLRDLDVILEWMKAHYPPFAGDPIFLEKR